MLERRQHWGELRVFYQDRDGHVRSLPADWTSQIAEDPFVVISAQRSRFRFADLVELSALIHEMGGR